MTDETADDHFSYRLGEIIGEELRRVGMSSLDLDGPTLLAVQRIAMRCAYQGTVELAAKLQLEDIHVELEPHLIDEDGVDLLLPPPSDEAP